jgi:hypothetical protein
MRQSYNAAPPHGSGAGQRAGAKSAQGRVAEPGMQSLTTGALVTVTPKCGAQPAAAAQTGSASAAIRSVRRISTEFVDKPVDCCRRRDRRPLRSAANFAKMKISAPFSVVKRKRCG